MKKSIKAALLSALLFPGVGHVFLKRYIPGVVLIGASFSGIYYLTSKMVERALQITDKILSGDIQMDAAAIAELVSKQPIDAEAYLVNIAAAVFFICWIIGTIDAYRVGRVQDKESGRGQT